jgi:VWFA-related protein
MKHCLSTSLALLFALSPGAGVQAQPRGDDPEETLYESIEVNVVSVEVFVTDRAGNPVFGLAKEDFTLLEDGRPVTVSHFHAAEREGVGESPGAAPAAAGANPAAPAPSVPDEQALLLAVFVDNQNLTPQASARLLPGVESFLADGIGPRDRLVLASYQGPGKLRVREATTADAATRIALLRETATGSTGLLGGSGQVRRLIREMERSSSPARPGASASPVAALEQAQERENARVDAREAFGDVETYAKEAVARSSGALAALEQLVDGLAGLPGRKAVLYVSGSFSLRPAQALIQAWNNRFGQLHDDERILAANPTTLAELDVDLTPRLEAIAARANANRVTLYALGVPDVVGALAASSQASHVWTAQQQAVELRNVEQTLQRLALPTGGIAALDPTDPRAVLDHLRRDFASYYSLGFEAPPGRRPGDHRLEVRLARPGLVVRHRESHRERTTSEAMVGQTLAALLFASPGNPLRVAAQLGEETATGDERQVPLTVKLPLDRLVLLPQGTQHEGRITVYVAVRDAEGRNSPVTEVKIPVRVANDQLGTARAQTAGYRTTLALRPLPHLVAIAVRDEIANVTSTITVPYAPKSELPPAPAGAAPQPPTGR